MHGVHASGLGPSAAVQLGCGLKAHRRAAWTITTLAHLEFQMTAYESKKTTDNRRLVTLSNRIISLLVGISRSIVAEVAHVEKLSLSPGYISKAALNGRPAL